MEVTVYDAIGRRLRTLVEDTRDAGWYTVRWDGRDARGRRAATGIYFIRLVTPEQRLVRKALLLQ